MPYSRDQIRQNWVNLRQALVKQGINMARAGASDRNPDLTALQLLLRGFFVQLMRNQPGEIVYGGEPVNGTQPDLIDFRYGATVNGRRFANKEAFLQYQGQNYVWAEDFFLAAGFDGLGIQPVYRYTGTHNGVQAPFRVTQAISVARLTCLSRAHWVRDGHDNDGAGNCGLYSAAQEVAANWSQIENWLDRGVSPFVPTQAALNGVRTKAEEHVEILAAQTALETELNTHSFQELLNDYLNLAKKNPSTRDERELVQSLRDAVILERPASQGMPLDIQANMRALIVPLLNGPDSAMPAGYPEATQAQLRPHLAKILALHMERFPLEVISLRDKPVHTGPTQDSYLAAPKKKAPEPAHYNPGTKAVSSLVTFCGNKFKSKKSGAAPGTAKMDIEALSRVDTATTLLNQYPDGWELEALQLVYENAARQFGFTCDPANLDQAKIIQALALECGRNPELSKMLNFFLTDVDPANPKTLAP